MNHKRKICSHVQGFHNTATYICNSCQNFGKRLSTNFTCTSIKIERNSICSENHIRKINQDYEIIINKLHLYYDMKLITFSIDRDKKLIIQFPVFTQTYTQQLLILYQIRNSTSPYHRSEHTGGFLHASTDGQTIHCTKLYHNQTAGMQNMQKNRL